MFRRVMQTWALTGLEPVYESDRRAVFLAESENFGPVVLKYNTNSAALSQEYAALCAFSGKSFCKVFAYDAEAHLLLEERILPGTPLRAEPDIHQRLRCFASVFQSIHRPTAIACPTYLDWLEKAYTNCLNLPLPADITQQMETALQFGQELFSKYSDRVLLHGDLHHDNILRSSDGSYRVIDPKGVSGPAVFDIPRFVLNELDPALGSADIPHIRSVIHILSELLRYEESDLAKLFFMETILANVWSMEDGEPADMQSLSVAAGFKDFQTLEPDGNSACTCLSKGV